MVARALVMVALAIPACAGHRDAPPVLGLTWHVATYEAELGQLGGGATIVGAADESDRAVGDLGGEASHRRAVELATPGDSIAWTTQAAEAGANAFVVRFSIPDAVGGGGAPGALEVAVIGGGGSMRYHTRLALSSRYAWLYGGVLDGTKLYDVPANAQAYATAAGPTHLYDEIQMAMPIALHEGDVIQLSEPAAAPAVAVDFLDLEIVPPALAQPHAFLSITDPECGATPSDTSHTRQVFDGVDDSSYASTFVAVPGTNPFNPPSFQTAEKVYYTTAPGDALQDGGASGMFALADHNRMSLAACVNAVAASGGRYAGVYVPPGRFYVRGVLAIPSGVTIQGAGMWHSKLVAVDTDAPGPATNGARTGIASVSGDLVLASATGGSDRVVVANLALFGNVTQRDVVDARLPIGIQGTFTNSTFDNIWVEHYFIGIMMNGRSSGVAIANSRARNTFADGIDFYGSTSQSTIASCQSRSTGDDGFAMWAQSATSDEVSHGNSITSSTALLQWYGDGFSIYGGTSGSITNSAAADILNYPCLQISTQFVPAALPAGNAMSASASNLGFYRCGGNGFNQAFGAVLVGVAQENVDGVALSGINIASPTYAGIDIRPLTGMPPIGTFANVSFDHVEIVGAATCGVIKAKSAGAAQLTDTCSCATVAAQPAACAVTEASTSFQITTNTCTDTACHTL
jgi:hypothetical protein